MTIFGKRVCFNSVIMSLHALCGYETRNQCANGKDINANVAKMTLIIEKKPERKHHSENETAEISKLLLSICKLRKKNSKLPVTFGR